jgi:uncharacterized iron-regulated membrane protein
VLAEGAVGAVYHLHFTLALGDVGIWLMGIIAILWTVDCFVGAYLTFPVSSGKAKKPWLLRWLPTWGLKTGKLFSLVFSWHRASGLWVWGLLLVFAWSAVALNLNDDVYRPLMNVVLPEDEHAEPPELLEARNAPKLDMRAARDRGHSLMAREAELRGFHVFGERWLAYDPRRGVYNFGAETSLDVGPRLADTHVVFDGDDGRLIAFHAATLTTRGKLDAWLVALHFGSVREGGLAYRIFVCVLGVLVALLSVTGVWIWLRKRDKRRAPSFVRRPPVTARPMPATEMAE